MANVNASVRPRPRREVLMRCQWRLVFELCRDSGADGMPGAKLVPKLPQARRNNEDDSHRFFESFVSVKRGGCTLGAAVPGSLGLK